jgi:hypothetical protein
VATVIDDTGHPWDEVAGHLTKETSKGLLDCVVVREQTEWDPKFAVLIRATPTGQDAKEFWRPVASLEAGQQLIAEQFAKAN